MKPTVSRSVFDNVSEEILIINVEDYTVVDVNRVFLEQVKMTKQEVIGKTCYEVTHNRSVPCAPPNDACPISEMLRTRHPIKVEHTHFDKDGNRFHVEIYASP